MKKDKGKAKTVTARAVIKPKALPVPAIVPKPTKADVINAALARAEQKIDQENESNDLKREDVMERIKAQSLALLKEQGVDAFEFSVDIREWGVCSTVGVEFTLDRPALRSLLKEHKKIPKHVRFNEVQERNKIKQALDSTQDRVALILSNEENVSLIDALLLKINTPKTK